MARTASERACFVYALFTFNVGETGKPLNIVFDNFSLEDGLQFDETFMRGMARSLVTRALCDGRRAGPHVRSQQRAAHRPRAAGVVAGARAGQGRGRDTAPYLAHLL